MTHHEVQLRPDADPVQVEQAVTEICEGQPLTAGLKTTLAACPGYVHWHWKRGRERGTLEVTERLTAAVGTSLAEETNARDVW